MSKNLRMKYPTKSKLPDVLRELITRLQEEVMPELGKLELLKNSELNKNPNSLREQVQGLDEDF